MKKKLSEEQIQQGLDHAYREAGENAYFNNGFKAGVKFAQKILSTQKNKKLKKMTTSDLIRFIEQHPEYTTIVIKGDEDRTPLQAINYLVTVDPCDYSDIRWKTKKDQDVLLVYL